MIEDFCKFFQNIEDNPDKIVRGLTIRDFLAARSHLSNCDSCYNRSERVLKKQPKKMFPEIGIN